MKHFKILGLFSAFVVLMSACSKKTEPVELNFESSTLYVDADTAVVTLALDAPATDHYPIKLTMESIGVAMGREFTIDPVSIYVNGTIYLTFPKGSTQQAFKIVKLSPVSEQQSPQVILGIDQTPAEILVGEHNQATIFFNHN